MADHFDRRMLLGAAGLAGVAALSKLAHAGDLNPPPGPITPTMKPLDQIEPRIAVNQQNTPGDADSLFKITQPGSYYLTGNITGHVGKHGIKVLASGVTIDLNGFELAGVPGMGAFDGISVTLSSVRNIEVRNGTVRGWGGEGIDLGALSVDSIGIVKDVRVSFNLGNGIAVGRACLITGCVAFGNNGHGIVAGTSTAVSACTAYDNSGDGISTSTGCTVVDCTTVFNSGNGISVNSGSSVSGCTAYANGSNGIAVTSDSRIADNTCDGNGIGGTAGAGIMITGSDNRIENNNCTDNGRGIIAGSEGNFIARNTCSGNSTNWDIVAGNICLVVLAATSGAISGDSGGTSPGTTNPNANFTY